MITNYTNWTCNLALIYYIQTTGKHCRSRWHCVLTDTQARSGSKTCRVTPVPGLSVTKACFIAMRLLPSVLCIYHHAVLPIIVNSGNALGKMARQFLGLIISSNLISSSISPTCTDTFAETKSAVGHGTLKGHSVATDSQLNAMQIHRTQPRLTCNASCMRLTSACRRTTCLSWAVFDACVSYSSRLYVRTCSCSIWSTAHSHHMK